jgi:hypothetical protein
MRTPGSRSRLLRFYAAAQPTRRSEALRGVQRLPYPGHPEQLVDHVAIHCSVSNHGRDTFADAARATTVLST